MNSHMRLCQQPPGAALLLAQLVRPHAFVPRSAVQSVI